VIRQPKNNNGIVWKSNFGSERTKQFSSAQKIIDSEMLRLGDPMVPRKEGELIKSGIRNTKIGSGLVRYVTPYAKRMYYGVNFNFRNMPTRGAKWFERVKDRYLDAIKKKVGDEF